MVFEFYKKITSTKFIIICNVSTLENITNFGRSKKKNLALQSDTIFHLNDSLSNSLVNEKSVAPGDTSVNIISDSIAASIAENNTTLSRFVSTSQKPIKVIKPRIIPQSTNTGLLAILIASLFMMALTRFTGKKVFHNIFQAVRSLKPTMQNVKFNEGSSAAFTIVLFLLTVMIYSVFVVILQQKFKFLLPGYEDYSMEQFIIILAIIGGLLIMQLLLTWLSGFIFNSGELAKKYTANSFAFNVISAIFLMPILMVSLFDRSSGSTYVAIGVVSLLFIFRTIKGTFITLYERKYLWCHFFIYFCTLEILPILIIIKATLIVKML